MSIRPLVIFIAAAGLWACESGKAPKTRTVGVWPTGKPKLVITYDPEDSTQTLEKYLYDDGAVKAEGQKSDTLRTGTWYSYYQNGKPWSMHTYRSGVLEGPYKTWHANGNLYQEGQLEAGRPVGKWMFFRENGSLDSLHDCSVAPLPWNQRPPGQ